MAVGANTYGAVTGVERLIGDIVSGRDFTGSTVPNTSQVEAELDNVAAEINAELESFGYTIPVDNSSYPTAYAYLKSSNEYGASARVLACIPSVTFMPDGDGETGNSRAQMYERYLLRAKEAIREHRLKAGTDSARFARIKAGALYDSNGNEKKPLFRRRMHEYPGSRTLVANEGDIETRT